MKQRIYENLCKGPCIVAFLDVLKSYDFPWIFILALADLNGNCNIKWIKGEML